MTHKSLSLLRQFPVCLRKSPFILCLTLLTLAAAAPRTRAQSLDGFTYNGIVYTSYQANEYLQTPQGPQGTAGLRATGATYSSVLATQYIQTSTSNTIAPETTSSPGYTSSDALTPTDAAVTGAIQNLQAQGLTVVMKPQVDSLDGVFRGSFAPSSPAAWFASYQTFLLHYAQLASQSNVGILIIGTELKSLSGAAYVTYWDNMIAQLRASYPNLTLIYGANATGAGDEFTTVSFWDKVDIIGVDGYFPLTNHADPTVAQLVAAWTDNLNGFNPVAALQALQSKYNKPLIFTEVGYVSAAGTNEAPYSNAAPGAAYDVTEQQNCYEAFFEVFSQQTAWMKGVFWWDWNVSPPAANDLGYSSQNKPASMVTLPKWFGSTTPGFSLAPSSSMLTLGETLSVSDTISLTDLDGFNGAVALTASGLPTGVTAAFANGAIAGTQIMTLTATGGASTGPSTVTVTGTSGSVTASATISLTVQAPAVQSITFNNPGSQLLGMPLTLSATASSGLAVTFTSSTPTVCTVAGNTASFLTAGTCTITASQAGNSSYAAATSVLQSFSVAGAPSFTLAPSSMALAVMQGSSATDTINVTDAFGFTGNVTLTTSGLPSGVTAALSANPATGSSVLTLTVASTAAVGAAMVTVTGTSGALTASTTFTLTVDQGPSFSLSTPNSALTIAPGVTASDTVEITSLATFSGPVTLTAAITSSPAGAQNPPIPSFGATSPVTLTTGAATATLTIATTPATTAQSHTEERGIDWRLGGAAMACMLLLLPARRRHQRLALGLLLLIILGTGGLMGCGGASTPSNGTTRTGTTTGTYTITVTATGGNASSTLPITLTVQ